MLLNDSTEVGASNARRLVAVYAANNAGFGIIHGLVDRVMACVQICPEEKYALNSLTADEYNSMKKIARAERVYRVAPTDDPLFFPGMYLVLFNCLVVYLS